MASSVIKENVALNVGTQKTINTSDGSLTITYTEVSSGHVHTVYGIIIVNETTNAAYTGAVTLDIENGTYEPCVAPTRATSSSSDRAPRNTVQLYRKQLEIWGEFIQGRGGSFNLTYVS